MGAPKNLIALLEFHHEKDPSSAGTDVLRFSETDESDRASYEGGFKEGRLRAITGPERAISDPGGDHFIGQAQISGDDTDHYWRARLNTLATAFVDGRDAVIKVVSEAVKAVEGAWTVLMRGKARELPMEDGLGWSLVLEEWIGSQFGPAFLDRQLCRPFRQEIFTDLPKALLDATRFVVPKVFGECTDKGAETPKGVCPGFFVGYRTFSISGPTPPESATHKVLLDPPPAPTYLKFGSGGSHTRTYACVIRTRDGGRTTLGASVTITGLPANGAFTMTNGVILYLAQYAADLQAQIAGIDLYSKDGNASSPAPWRYLDGAGEMFNTAANTPFTAGPHSTSGGIGYEDNGDDDHNKPYNPPPARNTAFVSQSYTTEGGPGVSKTYGRIVFGDSELHELLAVFGSSGGEDGEPIRVQWPIGDMPDVIVPGDTLWPDPDPFWDLTGSDGVTERFFGIYILASSPRLQHHIEGRVTIAAWLCGRPGKNGELVDQAFRAWQMLLSDAMSNDGKGYFTGDLPDIPLFGDGVEAISADSVQAAEALSAVLLGTDTGFIVSRCIAKPTTLREELRRFNRTYTSWSYLDNQGRISIGLINTMADATTGLPLREDIDDVISIGAPKEQKTLVENRVQFVCDFDADADTFRREPETLNHLGSQRQHKAIRERDLYEGYWTNDLDTMRCAMNQRLLLFNRAPRYFPLVTGSNGFGIDLMRQVLVTAHEGFGATGYQLTPALTIRHQDRISDGEVDHTCWELAGVLAQLGSHEDIVDGVHTWGDGEQTWGDGEEVWS